MHGENISGIPKIQLQYRGKVISILTLPFNAILMIINGFYLFVFICKKLRKNNKCGKVLLASKAVAKAMAQKEPTASKILQRAALLQVRQLH